MGGSCVITGAAGFIGSHLAGALLSQGRTVVGIDALDDNYDVRLKEWNLETLKPESRFRWVAGDLLDLDLDDLLRDADTVFHLAARPGVRESWGENFRLYERQNVLATQALLEACVRRRPRRVVYASSSSIYGEMPGRPVTEDDPQRPLSPYGVSKLAGEHLVLAYHRSFGLHAGALRFFTVYGPRQRPDMAFHRFFRSILTGKEMTLFGDGTQTRDVTHVEDAVRATILAAERGAAGGIYNIGGGNRVALNDVLHRMEELSGLRARIRREPRPAGDPLHTGADIARAAAEIGFRPQVGVSQGLDGMHVWMKDCLDRGL
ncbi:MAG: NAD-dependent epimerase/dehydratase family protein [Candidatus Eisenbacteria bacterium]|nr:NAD-dependent epimerase/dehydratase family protein [Candidatus Eisenbacteria bacterium]